MKAGFSFLFSGTQIKIRYPRGFSSHNGQMKTWGGFWGFLVVFFVVVCLFFRILQSNMVMIDKMERWMSIHPSQQRLIFYLGVCTLPFEFSYKKTPREASWIP